MSKHSKTLMKQKWIFLYFQVALFLYRHKENNLMNFACSFKFFALRHLLIYKGLFCKRYMTIIFVKTNQREKLHKEQTLDQI